MCLYNSEWPHWKAEWKTGCDHKEDKRCCLRMSRVYISCLSLVQTSSNEASCNCNCDTESLPWLLSSVSVTDVWRRKWFKYTVYSRYTSIILSNVCKWSSICQKVICFKLWCLFFLFSLLLLLTNTGRAIKHLLLQSFSNVWSQLPRGFLHLWPIRAVTPCHGLIGFVKSIFRRF